jgi:hypothetical protein
VEVWPRLPADIRARYDRIEGLVELPLLAEKDRRDRRATLAARHRARKARKQSATASDSAAVS